MKGWFWAATTALLGAMGAAEFISARGENQTWDEGIHLAAGYSYIRTGDFRLNPEHPPLFKLLAGLTLVPLKPQLPIPSEAWDGARQLEFSDRFLYQGRPGADEMLLRGRSVTLALSLALGLAIAVWTRRHFGEAAALGALFLYALDPNVIAHSRYVTNDMWVTAFVFFATIAWARYLRTGTVRDLLLAGVTLGLALVTKFTALFTLPVMAALYAARSWQTRRFSARHAAASFAAAAALAALVIAAAYGPATLESLGGPALTSTLKEPTLMNAALRRLGWFFDLPDHPYFRGLSIVGRTGMLPHPAFLMGDHSNNSWWRYYPTVFALKAPTAAVLATLACIALGVWPLTRGPRLKLREEGAFRWVVLAAPITVYVPMLLISPLALGIRYMLPLFPFLWILVAAVITQRARRWMLACLGALLLAETAAIHPYYLAFFNAPSGGPGDGPRYLVDSNIDWGQDLKRLSQYLRSVGWNRPIPIAYFGSAKLSYYGVEWQELPKTGEAEKRAKLDSLAAISVTMLQSPYTGEDYGWLRELKPMAKVGYSIYVYDLRKGGRR